MEFAVQKSTGQKCSQRSCGEVIPAGEPIFLTTTVAFGERGSCLGFHPKCVQPDQVSSVVSDWSKVEGWKKMNEELKKEVQTAFEQVLRNKDQKKAATPNKRKPEASTKTTAAKSNKSSKASTPAKAKDKTEKAEKKVGGPKKASSAYLCFGVGERQNVIDQNGGPDKVAPKEVMTLLGAAWKNADAATKQKYEDEAKKDKERYAAQKAEFDKTGTYTKTPEEVALEESRVEKAKASKEKSKLKAAAAKKKPEAEEKKSAKNEETAEGGAAGEEGAGTQEGADDAVEEVEEAEEEEPAKEEEEVEDAEEVAEE